MSTRLVVTIAAPVALRLRTHWRSALAVLVLGVLAVALLTPSRSLAHAGRSPEPALALPDIPAAGPALMWTEIARAPSQTQSQSLGELLSLLSGLAWIGFGVAGISMCRTPRWARASTTALTIAGGAPTVADSPTPLAPIGWCGEGVTVLSVSQFGVSMAVGTR